MGEPGYPDIEQLKKNKKPQPVKRLTVPGWKKVDGQRAN
jgi:hypothetical protein